MKKAALLALVVAAAAVAVSSPTMARSHHHHHLYRQNLYRQTFEHRAYRERPAISHANITCDMVRAYVAEVGLVQARAMAQSAGMTASEERRAIRCLEKRA